MHLKIIDLLFVMFLKNMINMVKKKNNNNINVVKNAEFHLSNAVINVKLALFSFVEASSDHMHMKDKKRCFFRCNRTDKLITGGA